MGACGSTNDAAAGAAAYHEAAPAVAPEEAPVSASAPVSITVSGKPLAGKPLQFSLPVDTTVAQLMQGIKAQSGLPTLGCYTMRFGKTDLHRKTNASLSLSAIAMQPGTSARILLVGGRRERTDQEDAALVRREKQAAAESISRGRTTSTDDAS